MKPKTWSIHDGHPYGDDEPIEPIYSRILTWLDTWMEINAEAAIDGIISLDLLYKACEHTYWIRPIRGFMEQWYRSVLEASSDNYESFATAIEECNQVGFDRISDKWLKIFNGYINEHAGYREIAEMIQCHLNERRASKIGDSA